MRAPPVHRPSPDAPPSSAAPGIDGPAPVKPLREPIPSEALFAGATEVQIAHRGALYRLKLTALGKLILTK